MNTIWKYSLKPATLLELPANAEILSVDFQEADLCMWVKLDTDDNKVTREFKVYGTGHVIDDPENLSFLGTAHLDGLVFHIFEVAIMS